MGGSEGEVMGIKEGIFWDEHWVLYGNQFDNKFHILKKQKQKKTKQKNTFLRCGIRSSGKLRDSTQISPIINGSQS